MIMINVLNKLLLIFKVCQDIKIVMKMVLNVCINGNLIKNWMYSVYFFNG